MGLHTFIGHYRKKHTLVFSHQPPEGFFATFPTPNDNLVHFVLFHLALVAFTIYYDQKD